VTDGPRTYASLATAKKAINAAELGREVVRYDPIGLGTAHRPARVKPVILCDTKERMLEVKRKGFAAEVKAGVFRQDATVRLKDEVPKEKPGELAKIQRFVKSIDGGVYLDRRIGGTRWWNIEDLVLIAPGMPG